MRNPSRMTSSRAACSSIYWDFGRRWLRMGYHVDRKCLGSDETGEGKDMAQNGQGSRDFGDVAGQPKSMWEPGGISHSKEADHSCMIHFGHGRDRKSILVTLPTWCLATFKLSERFSLPRSYSPNDLPGGLTEISNVRRIRRMNRHPVESDENRASSKRFGRPRMA